MHSASMSPATHRLPEEHDVGLHEPRTRPLVAPDDLALLHGFAHLLRIVLLLAVDAVLGREAAVGFHEPVRGDARLTLECVDVLREACVEQAAVGKQLHEGVRERGSEAPGVELAGEAENWLHDAVPR